MFVLCTGESGSVVIKKWPASAESTCLLSQEHGSEDCCAHASPLYNCEALRTWLLKCCQASRGGLRDKPGKLVDYYHTCYCLSGLAASLAYAPQHK